MSRPLRAVADGSINVDAAAVAVEDLMRALGMDPADPSLTRTPRRVANAYAELLSPREFGLTTFPNDEEYDELVVARDIPFVSLCEHHLLPFVGTASVGYLPGTRILGLSKLARVVELFARRPQVQERMTKQAATWLDQHLHPRGVGVVIRAEHTCMTLRGVQARGATTVTSALLGTLRDDPRSRAEFLGLTT
jgi:GTP cyclohydrolase I